MCRLLALFHPEKKPLNINIIEFKALLDNMYYEGHSSQSVVLVNNTLLGHNRLAITDLQGGNQPFTNSDNDNLIVNGEIFNHEQLGENYLYSTKSDCECIIPIVKDTTNSLELGLKLSSLDGQFAFVFSNGKTKDTIVARDRIGIVSLYYGIQLNGQIMISSTIRSLGQINKYSTISHFPPGHCMLNGKLYCYWTSIASNVYSSNDETYWSTEIYNTLYTSVKSQLMRDKEVPIAFLLSGGIDSSAVCSIAVDIMKPEKINTFCIGMSEDSLDVVYAKKVAEYLGTNHTTVLYSEEDIKKEISEIIGIIETIDCTTIRASLPMYILTKEIHRQGYKVLLSGEGNDELFLSYLYGHYAPNWYDFIHECADLVSNLYQFDCLRVCKSTIVNSVETRVPILSNSMVDLCLHRLPVIFKQPLASSTEPLHKKEKWIFRLAFKGHLPDEIVYRTKHAFSDIRNSSGDQSVNSVAILKKLASENQDFIPEDFPNKAILSKSKEEQWYKKMFNHHFPGILQMKWSSNLFTKIWRPKWTTITDPSATMLDVYTVK